MKPYTLFLLGLGILSILAGCDGEDSNNLTSVALLDDRQIQGTPGRLSEDTTGSEIESPQYPEGTTVIVAIGDSITYGQDSLVGGYPTMLQQKFLAAGYSVIVENEGIRGERSPVTDTRFLEVIPTADIVLIMIGTNDIIDPAGCPDPYNCNTIFHIEQLIDKALVSKTLPLISTVPPARPGSDYEWANIFIEALNAQIYEIAAERNIQVVDNYTAILSNGGSALYSDRLHFTDQGYDLIADQWYTTIVENKLIQSYQK